MTHYRSKIQMRQWSNEAIISKISDIIRTHPELRFCQILSILGLDKDRFYEESIDTLNDVTDTMTKFNF